MKMKPSSISRARNAAFHPELAHNPTYKTVKSIVILLKELSLSSCPFSMCSLRHSFLLLQLEKISVNQLQKYMYAIESKNNFTLAKKMFLRVAAKCKVGNMSKPKGRVELPTSSLLMTCSNQLSYLGEFQPVMRYHVIQFYYLFTVL